MARYVRDVTPQKIAEGAPFRFRTVDIDSALYFRLDDRRPSPCIGLGFNRDFPLARIERVAWREFSGQVE